MTIADANGAADVGRYVSHPTGAPLPHPAAHTLPLSTHADGTEAGPMSLDSSSERNCPREGELVTLPPSLHKERQQVWSIASPVTVLRSSRVCRRPLTSRGTPRPAPLPGGLTPIEYETSPAAHAA